MQAEYLHTLKRGGYMLHREYQRLVDRSRNDRVQTFHFLEKKKNRVWEYTAHWYAISLFSIVFILKYKKKLQRMMDIVRYEGEVLPLNASD